MVVDRVWEGSGTASGVAGDGPNHCDLHESGQLRSGLHSAVADSRMCSGNSRSILGDSSNSSNRYFPPMASIIKSENQWHFHIKSIIFQAAWCRDRPPIPMPILDFLIVTSSFSDRLAGGTRLTMQAIYSSRPALPPHVDAAAAEGPRPGKNINHTATAAFGILIFCV